MMLRADEIELALLNLIVDSAEPFGPSFQLPGLQSALSRTVGFISDRETTDALLQLCDEGLVSVGKYVRGGLVPFDRREGARYFHYGSEFKCTPEPKARRRQQELAKGNRSGIFISHITPEAPVGRQLQALLRAALTPTVPVFVSSDYDSIPSGQWYAAILDGLRKSEVIVSLLSPASVDKRWINFEAGFGMGRETEVIPIVWCGLNKGDIGMPLGQLQARALNDVEDMRALLRVLGSICGCSVNDEALKTFAQDLRAAEAAVPSTELLARVVRTKSGALKMTIRNVGSRQLDLVDAELLIPSKLVGNNQFREYQPVLQIRCFNADGINLVGRGLTTHPSNILHLGVNPLRSILTPQMGEILIEPLGVALPRELSTEDQALPIRYMVQSRQTSVGPVMQRIADVPVVED